jgi:hypothetical protein
MSFERQFGVFSGYGAVRKIYYSRSEVQSFSTSGIGEQS